MPMRVKLSRYVAGVGGLGETVTLDDERANALVSDGAAQQVNPFAITENYTQAPPWSAEKLAAHRGALTGQAAQLEEAVKAQEQADKDFESAQRAAAKDADEGEGAAAAAVPGATSGPASGVVGGALGPQGGPVDPEAASKTPREREDQGQGPQTGDSPEAKDEAPPAETSSGPRGGRRGGR